jgi:hypothetical protein
MHMNKNISAGMYKMEIEQRKNSDDHCAARSLYTNSYRCGTIYQNGTTKEIRELFWHKKREKRSDNNRILPKCLFFFNYL